MQIASAPWTQGLWLDQLLADSSARKEFCIHFSTHIDEISLHYRETQWLLQIFWVGTNQCLPSAMDYYLLLNAFKYLKSLSDQHYKGSTVILVERLRQKDTTGFFSNTGRTAYRLVTTLPCLTLLDCVYYQGVEFVQFWFQICHLLHGRVK